MNNSPGWASPGSTPSDEPDRGVPEEPTQQTAPEGRPDAAEQATPPNWSKQQPPAGQWSAPGTIPGQSGPAGPRGRAQSGPGPAGTPGSGQGGWGGPPGWGTGWSPAPAAAKPGVIPLRPLAIGEILDGAVSTMRAHWRTVLGISLVIAVIAQTAITVVTGLWLPDAGRAPAIDTETAAPLEETFRDLANTLLASGVTSLIGLLATITATGMLTMVVSRAVLGRSVTVSEAWRDSRAQLPRLFGLLFLLPLLFAIIVMVGMAPGLIVMVLGSTQLGLMLSAIGGLISTVTAVWLWVRVSLASPALMLEKQGIISAIRRSAKLVRGSWWRVLGAQLLTYVLIAIVDFIVQIPATLVAFLIDGDSLMDWMNGTSGSTGWTFLTVLGVGAVISSTVTFPISAGVTALLYMDQRIRREALDLELARAAGLPGYGTQAPIAPQAGSPESGTAGSAPADGPEARSTDSTPGS